MSRKKIPSVPGKKPLDYPDQSHGARLAAEIRQRANKLTPEQRREHFRQAMAMIYASDQTAKASSAGH